MCEHRVQVTTLYDVLGVSPDASTDQLRRAYRQAARLLHPDLNPAEGSAEAMGRLNDAWSVLGDPDRRRRYDAGLGAPRPAAPAEHTVRQVGDEVPLVVVDHPLARLLRPSVLILAVLGIIFVVTAYAAPRSSTRTPVVTTTPSADTTPVTAAAGGSLPTAATTAAQAGSAGGAGGAGTETGGAPTLPGVAVTPAAPAGAASPDRPASPAAPAGDVPVGRCITPQSGYDAVVPCNQAGAQVIVAGVSRGADCPTASRPYQLAGQAQIVCLAPANQG